MYPDNHIAFYTIQSLEKILESLESENLTSAEIKRKALSDGNAKYLAFCEREREREKERYREEEREQKEREANDKRLKEKEEAKAKSLKEEEEEARCIALEEKRIDEERVKKWAKFHNFTGKFGAISTTWHCILSSLFL